MLFLAFNLACGFAQNKGQLMAFRFLAGLGGSAPLGVGGGVLADVWSPDQRGLSVSIYSLAPLLGPAIGPIAGGFITENTTWRWTFWATTMADAIVQFLGIIFLRESYALLLLQRKAAKLNKESGQEIYIGPGATQHHTIGHVLRHSLIRPAKMLATQPIVQALAIYMAFIYGLMYLVLSTFPTLWTTVYGESVGTGSLNYLSLGIGFLLGSQIPAHLNDSVYRRLKARNSGLGTPEFRVPLMIPGSLLVPFGLFIYGWTAQYHTHWIFPNLGAAIFAAGVVMCFQCMQTYLIEAYTTFAASAVAAATVLRSLAGFGFPLFAPSMYDSLQHGWGNSLVAFIAIGLGIPAPFLLWAFGEKLRGKSPYVAGTTLNG
ncbi:putative mfs multidrug [Phaeomoniella chlamydospora]|uniref:Putative mfs multidrug n=1 Tax=Phaeomoniella chlamydospora TaxID=158046 RepID=A0A0G2H8K9_PHACM|nr:putative mfs multidrug [Phaeomoniella chlamydospora]